MQPPTEIAANSRATLRHAAPTFYLTGRQPFSPAAILLAILAAAALLALILFALAHPGRFRLIPGDSASAQSAGSQGTGDDADDDPNQIDTIVLGDPTEAPRPAHRGDHVSPVHPTILVVLPRSGDHFGQIPDSATGRLLYAWLAAFNQANPSALAEALPTPAPAAAAEMELRRKTGGFTLLSAREVQPGLMVFRMRDQAAPPTEVLGTLWVTPDSAPPAIAAFSLRAVGPPASAP